MRPSSSGVEKAKETMIEGLGLTMTGEEVRNILRDRIDYHTKRAERWRQDAARENDQRTEAAQWMPGEWCQSEAEAEEWRAQRLSFIREHIDPSEVYRLGAGDVKFGELLPPQPVSMDQRC